MTTDPIDRELAIVAAEIARTDTKASALLSADSLLGAVLGLIVNGGHVHAAATITAAIVLGAALVLAALVIRPRLKKTDKASYPHYATLSAPALVEVLVEDRRAEKLLTLCKIADHKMKSLRWATDVTIAAIAAISLAATLTAAR
ncbi:Pycsar system effector family protein [Kitasatospora sp. NPDC056731]|uniref:Pycsar system effector family protein n=1 Tax=Kitasatospora sp. NPDC056731 TaxID=3155422 RepID=UPI00342B8ED7